MNLTRVESAVAVERMTAAKVVAIGGAFGLVECLARTGVGTLTCIDFGVTDETNAARQDLPSKAGKVKVEVIGQVVRRINPRVKFTALRRDVCSLTNHEVLQHIAGADLMIDGTDSFCAKARVNILALEQGIPLLAIGLYEQGKGGEVFWWKPSAPADSAAPSRRSACYRCFAQARYDAFFRGVGNDELADETDDATRASSRGATIMDLRILDGIAGQIALGIINEGADNRYGRLMEQLDGRQGLIVKIDPTFQLGEPDWFTQRLGDDPAHFAFNTLALRVRPDPECPDCARYTKATRSQHHDSNR